MRRLLALAALALATPAGADGEVVRVEHHDPTALPARGPANAPVTIELFFTPGQTSRSSGYHSVEKLQALHPTRIRLVYRILGGNGSARLQYAALEAFAEGKFFELMDHINCVNVPVSQCRTRGGLTTKDIVDMGSEIGIDPDRLAAAIARPPAEYDRALAANDRRRKQRFGTTQNMPSALFNGKAPQTTLNSLGMADLEREYRAARTRAEEALDKGATPHSLLDALDEDDAPAPADILPQPGPTDDELDQIPLEPPLATPPLRTEGMPSFGSPTAAVTIVVLCSPTSDKCAAPRRAARQAQESFPDDVRVVWAPYFDASKEDAGDMGLLSDGALCAETVGTSADDDVSEPASPGWRWVDALIVEAASRRRHVPAEQEIDKLAGKLHVERHAFARCRAAIAGKSVAWAADARRSGVRTTPATIVGGRIYGPITDPKTLMQLVQVELAPGWLGEGAPTWRRRL
jgi:hypothetical protein